MTAHGSNERQPVQRSPSDVDITPVMASQRKDVREPATADRVGWGYRASFHDTPYRSVLCGSSGGAAMALLSRSLAMAGETSAEPPFCAAAVVRGRSASLDVAGR